MCLLVVQNERSPSLDDAWLKDFYSYNSDGVGLMFADPSGLQVEKILPKDENDFIQFYKDRIAGKNCAFHLRMRTHGDIDLLNCHPYEVLNKKEHGLDLWMMHNGILSTGNASDPSKSDTWHYIQKYLKPMLIKNPDYAFTQSFKDVIGCHITSSNKFVLMDDQGRQAIINQSSGVFWAGLWLSNTYAWSASSNASKNPVGKKQWGKQAKEKPVVRSYKSYQMPYSYDDYAEYDDLDYSQIELLFDDLSYCGYAVDVSLAEMEDFACTFGMDSLIDIVDMVLTAQIEQDVFQRAIKNFQFARTHLGFKTSYKTVSNHYWDKGYAYE